MDHPFGTPADVTTPHHLPRCRVGLNGDDFLEERSRKRGDRAHPGKDGSFNELDLVIGDAKLVGCATQQPDGAIFLVRWGRANRVLLVFTTACDYLIQESMWFWRHE